MNLIEYNKCGFKRISVVIPKVHLGDVEANCHEIASLCNANPDSDILLFPELSVTGYSLGDLFNQQILSEKAIEGVLQIAESTKTLKSLIVVGTPVRHNDNLYNCAIAIHKGKIICIIPKSFIPNYGEYYEARWFTSGLTLKNNFIQLGIDNLIPFGTKIILEFKGMKIGMEICEDLWVPIPPSSELCMAGANVILNLSASNNTLGKQSYRSQLIAQQSARCRVVYAYSSAGHGESSTDLAFPGFGAIAENGEIIASSSNFPDCPAVITADFDISRLINDRIKFNTFKSGCRDTDVLTISIEEEIITKPSADNIHNSDDCEIILKGKKINPHPFVPSDRNDRDKNCSEIIAIQCHGLRQRLEAIHCKKVVIGVSGGLDSTLALLIAYKTFKISNLSLDGIVGITMPGLATTSKTRNNAWRLMELLGITSLEIPIGKSVEQHFKDISQDPLNFDATYENSQARERTQILMDYANKVGGIVLGTGDLSELALGWCTYNGDHISMYGVNASIPKTLVKHLVQWFAKNSENPEIKRVLEDIINTPISPELVPSSEKDSIGQKTEDLVGPYELHDFFLYNMLRNSFKPSKIFYLAKEAFREKYDEETIKKWLNTFYRRFFSQQFKRSCMPDGPKVGSVCLSPRGDWRMPSDAMANLWLKDLEKI